MQAVAGREDEEAMGGGEGVGVLVISGADHWELGSEQKEEPEHAFTTLRGGDKNVRGRGSIV